MEAMTEADSEEDNLWKIFLCKIKKEQVMLKSMACFLVEKQPGT